MVDLTPAYGLDGGVVNRVASVVFWAFVAVSSVLLFPVALVIWALTAPFDRRRVLLHRFTCWWASLYTWLNPLWPVTVRGRERMDSRTTYVMVANHLSLLDILVLFRLFRHFTWVSKIENFKVPFIGWNMWLNGYIPLRRGDRDSIARMMVACERAIVRGESVMMFPEGTRSRTGELQAFKPGAFDLAIRTGSPVLPILIEGTADALPKRGFVLRGRHPIRITVLDPIPPSDFAGRDARALADDVHGVFAARLAADAEPAGA